MRTLQQLLVMAWLFGSIFSGYTQPAKQKNAAEILLGLNKLNVLGTALYIAAHPDDENTRLITYLANEKLWQTAYLSLTRGDGGQNLIGSEQGNALGIIRTQELLQARRIDGGKQYFGTARDFGFSKTPAETFTKWDRKKVLSEIVWLIRTTRPDVIITRFSPEAGKTHGHHTASAMLAVEAFSAAADPGQFPEQLQHTSVWQATRIVWNSSRFFYGSQKELEEKKPINLEVGLYNELLGQSYGEIAAKSRSMHKSQGFGSGPGRGAMPEYFEFLKGKPIAQTIFDEVPATWLRVEGGAVIEKSVQNIISTYQPTRPQESVPQLLSLYQLIQQLKEPYWKTVKSDEVKELIKQCLALHLEVSTDASRFTNSDNVGLSVEVYNRSDTKVVFEKITFGPASSDTIVQSTITPSGINFKLRQKSFDQINITQPYWLEQDGSLGMFGENEKGEIGLAENPSVLISTFSLKIDGYDLDYRIPVFHKYVDPVKGEVYKNITIVPGLALSSSKSLLVYSGKAVQDVNLTITSNQGPALGVISIGLPKGWKSQPESYPFTFQFKGQQQTFTFGIIPGGTITEGEAKFTASTTNQKFSRNELTLDYSHILPQTYFPAAVVKLKKIDLKKKANTVGYIMGPGDLVPACLEQVGYKVVVLQPGDLNLAGLKLFDAVIVGVRAYNTNPSLKLAQKVLYEYVFTGGTLIVQYQNQNGLVVDSLGPYPLKLSSERVTVEDGPVSFLTPNHPILKMPNVITEKDFEGWVQERGLYYPIDWDKRYNTIISTRDPDEPAKSGGLLVAKYGRGNFIYSSLAWFRQLPAGVPGAYRLFVNMISLGR